MRKRNASADAHGAMLPRSTLTHCRASRVSPPHRSPRGHGTHSAAHTPSPLRHRCSRLTSKVFRRLAPMAAGILAALALPGRFAPERSARRPRLPWDRSPRPRSRRRPRRPAPDPTSRSPSAPPPRPSPRATGRSTWSSYRRGGFRPGGHPLRAPGAAALHRALPAQPGHPHHLGRVLPGDHGGQHPRHLHHDPGGRGSGRRSPAQRHLLPDHLRREPLRPHLQVPVFGRGAERRGRDPADHPGRHRPGPGHRPAGGAYAHQQEPLRSSASAPSMWR